MASSSLENSDFLSRPLRLAAELRGEDEATVEHVFAHARTLVRLEQDFCDMPDAREAFLFAVTQVVRFCPNLAVCIPSGARELVAALSEISARAHGGGHAIQVVDIDDARRFDAVLNIGTEILDAL